MLFREKISLSIIRPVRSGLALRCFKWALLLSFPVWPISALYAQPDSSLSLIRQTGREVVDFTADNLGNIYTIDKDNQLKKYSLQGDSIAVFNDVKRYGRLFSIDATNPLRLLLFYKDFGTLVILDRFLTVKNTIDIRRQGIFQAVAVAQAFDNGIWIYDEQEARLKRIDVAGNILFQSADFRQIMETAPAPVVIEDQDRLVYMYDPAQGVYIFDYFGTLKNKVSLLGWSDFQVIGSDVFGRKENMLQRYRLNSLSITELPLEKELAGADKIKVAPGYLYCLKEGKVAVYRFH